MDQYSSFLTIVSVYNAIFIFIFLGNDNSCFEFDFYNLVTMVVLCACLLVKLKLISIHSLTFIIHFLQLFAINAQ